MRRLVIISVSALTLAGCGYSADPGEKREDGEIQLQAGKWANTVKIEKFDPPAGAPKATVDAAKKLKGFVNSTESCLTKDQLELGLKEQALGKAQAKDCKTENYTAEGGIIKGHMVCSTGGQKADITIDGTYTANSSVMSITATIEDKALPGTTTMVTKVTGNRVGDCAGG